MVYPVIGMSTISDLSGKRIHCLRFPSKMPKSSNLTQSRISCGHRANAFPIKILPFQLSEPSHEKAYLLTRVPKSARASLSAWRNFASMAIHNPPSEDSDQIARMRSLIWIFAERSSKGTFSDVDAQTWAASWTVSGVYAVSEGSVLAVQPRSLFIAFIIVRKNPNVPNDLDWLQSPVTKYFSHNPVW